MEATLLSMIVIPYLTVRLMKAIDAHHVRNARAHHGRGMRLN